MKKRYVLSFPLETVQEPITYYLVKDYDLKINIINADITPGKEGNLLLGIWGEENNIEKGVAYLESKNIQCTAVEKRIIWDEDKCVHCGSCSSVCFPESLTMDKESWQLQFDTSKCIVCGFCVKACPFGCFELEF